MGAVANSVDILLGLSRGGTIDVNLSLGSIQVSLSGTEEEEVDIHIRGIVRCSAGGIVVVPLRSSNALCIGGIGSQLQSALLAIEDSAVVGAGSTNLGSCLTHIRRGSRGKDLQELRAATHSGPGTIGGGRTEVCNVLGGVLIVLTPHSSNEEARTTPPSCGNTILLEGKNGLATGTVGAVVAHK